MPVKSRHVGIKQTRKDVLGNYCFDCVMYSNKAGQIKWFSDATVTLAEEQKANMGAYDLESIGIKKYSEALQQGFLRGLQESDATTVYEKLTACINENQLELFIELLNNDYIYGAKKTSRSTAQDVYYVVFRSNIEALINHEFLNFEQLVDQLLEKNDAKFYAAFQEILKLKVGSAIARSLFLWDKRTQEKTTQKLEDIYNYGVLLSQKESIEAKSKGTVACEIASQLFTKVKNKHPNQLQPNDYKSQFENLKFKLEIAKDLHAKDKLFAGHRNWYKGWDHVVANLCIFLFTLSGANVLKDPPIF